MQKAVQIPKQQPLHNLRFWWLRLERQQWLAVMEVQTDQLRLLPQVEQELKLMHGAMRLPQLQRPDLLLELTRLQLLTRMAVRIRKLLLLPNLQF